jgi:hypothetical protein
MTIPFFFIYLVNYLPKKKKMADLDIALGLGLWFNFTSGRNFPFRVMSLGQIKPPIEMLLSIEFVLAVSLLQCNKVKQCQNPLYSITCCSFVVLGYI